MQPSDPARIRPGRRSAAQTTFSLFEKPIPNPSSGHMLRRALWMSLDPYMLAAMSDAKSYSDPVPVGGVDALRAVCPGRGIAPGRFRQGPIL